ncbi:MAG: prolipoprotein diacylglyceryl transferase [Deltaproteobacteria bacterium]|nr:prolipoprotein diacylglyceryl transferase [Deltaproteobacteria bacterium]
MLRDPVLATWLHIGLEYAGIAVGGALYRRARRRAGLPPLHAPKAFAVTAGLLLGAALGNKLVFLIERPDLLAAWWRHGTPFALGQSMVGGLLGGLLGTELAKWWTRQPTSTGDALVLPVTAGLVVGRIGCFLAGLQDDTYGLATSLPWGIDLGDGVARHPTPLYEIGFVLSLCGLLQAWRGRLAAVAGLQWKLFLTGYLLWRAWVDGLKPVPVEYVGGLSGIQVTCWLALAVYAPVVVRAAARLRGERQLGRST